MPAAGVLIALLGGGANADTIDLGAVGVAGVGTGASPASAPPVTTVAPTSAPLSATQPTSVINEQFIRNAVPPSGNYDTIVRIAPSVLAISPNGPGLGEATAVTIRGFSDGQYNVTFDGIPFGDSDDFTHHSNAYFTAHELRATSVDRGPGTASTIGDATFGGTISLLSRDPAPTRGAELYGTFGSFGTHLYGATLDTGAVATLNGGAYYLNAEKQDTDGYLTGVGQERSSLFFKGVQPIGKNTVLTAVATTLWQTGDQPVGATAAQINTYGPNFALTNNPQSQNFVGFNGESYRTDFEYLGIQSQLTGALSIDNKVYTYGLYRRINAGLDVNGSTPNGTVYGAMDVPGRMSRIDVRAYGDVLRLEDKVSFGALRSGLWVEHQVNSRSQYYVDETLGGALNATLTPVPGVPDSAAISRLQRDGLDTFQPYVEAVWQITPKLDVTAGLKWAVFHRTEDSPVNQGTRLPLLDTSLSWDAPLPAVAVHYTIDAGWAAYAQFAKGFLAPQLEFLDVPDPKSNTIAPESTTNYQIGSTWHRGPYALSADAYYIVFDNMVGTRTVGGEAQVFNEGGVDYYGFEAEGAVGVGGGLSLYGNGSVNRALEKEGGAPVPNTPALTAAAGLIYSKDGWYGALIDKWIGTRYGDVNRAQPLQPFNQLDFSLAWDWAGRPGVVPPLKAQFSAQNLLDSRKIVQLAGYTATGGTPLYYTQAGRSFFLGASVRF